MRDSPETLEWYEECIQRNFQIHAQIPVGYQPSIVYCHTGRRTIITPAKRYEQRRVSIDDAQETMKTSVEHDETEASTLTQMSTEPVTQSQSDGSRSQTVIIFVVERLSLLSARLGDGSDSTHDL
jgi:hypothetical protein